ncbi:hypothetical protein [Holdemanella biformis]|uniref:hypothetical protein n=1 Tax=Holdemanella biformis TaxID=1735 RepID=UPI002E79BAA0|nr:hypothetical protein [Holdemanella biformis]
MKTKQILTAGAIALSMILTGCSASSTGTKDTKTTEVAKKKAVKTIGQKTKDSKSLKITNNTGKKITVFETKSSSEESFSDNLLENGDTVKNKEERTLYYTVKENDKLDVKVGLQDQDKTFVFKDVDTTDTKKVDVSLKDDKVNLDVTKKDGSTVTLTPSEDSAKTEDEKKDEQEVKQEEKKEETAKADSSNKSNTSESKKNNTASTSNSSSNKNNSSSNSSKPSSKPSNSSSNNSGSSKPSNNNGSNSSNSKPAEHTHNWVAQYKTVNVPEKGHNEQVLVKDAYDEPTYGYEYHSFCNTCGLDLTANGINDAQHVKQHTLNGEGGSATQKPVEVQTGTIHHEAVYETRYVVDSPATTKQELAGYKCSSCGKTRAN